MAQPKKRISKSKNSKGAINLIKKIHECPDFIYAPRYKNSLKNFLKNHPNGTDDFAVIAKMLLLTEEQVKELYKSAINKMQNEIERKKECD